MEIAITIIAAILLLVGLWPIGIPLLIIGIYCLVKRNRRKEVEYQYKYQQYKEAEAELNDIEADLRQHQYT